MNPTNKPLHQDLSFWIVAVVLVSAASAIQLYYALPWFSAQLAQARPAPRPAAGVQMDTGLRSTPKLDTRKKTYSWQTPQFVSGALEDTPPQVVLIPTEYEAPTSRWGQRRSDRAISFLTSDVERTLRLPGLDQAGLTGQYDIEISKAALDTPGPPAGQLDKLRSLFLDQRGLNLVVTNAALEFLVVKKASQTP